MTALTLLILPPRRPAYLLGAAVCAGLMGWALWLQYGLQLEPCPLCVVQRVIVIAMGVIFLVAGLHNPGRIGAAVYAGLVVVAGAYRRGGRRAPRLDPGAAPRERWRPAG